MGILRREDWGSTPGNWDPLHALDLYPGEPVYGIPSIERIDPPPAIPEAFVSWPNRRRARPSDGLHFFADDYRFESVWKMPPRYRQALVGAPLVLSPDFSIYSDWPIAMQLWQTYRARWMARTVRAMGAAVIPAVTWGGPASFDFAFLGLPVGGDVAVTTVGRSRASAAWDAGFAAMLERVAPRRVVAIGSARLPSDLERRTDIHYRQSDALRALRGLRVGCSSARQASHVEA